MAINNYYYNKQIKSYLMQFMAIFSGLKVDMSKQGTEQELASVPIQYGFKDRVVAHILNANTQNKLLRLPMMSVYLTDLNLAPELRKGIGGERRTNYLPRGEVFPDGIKTVEQLMPVPYRAHTELSIYASNQEQMFQILEQILMMFDPTLQIQLSDGLFDWAKNTVVELDGIRPETNYPPATERRIIVWTLTFNFAVYLSAPANLKSNFIKDINIRIGIINGTIDPNTVVDVFDGEGLNYETWFSIDDLQI